MEIVGIRKRGEVKWKVICHTYSHEYALAVARKWRKRGYDTMIEDIQQDDDYGCRFVCPLCDGSGMMSDEFECSLCDGEKTVPKDIMDGWEAMANRDSDENPERPDDPF